MTDPLDRIRDLAEEILDLADDSPEPGGLTAPTGFTATLVGRRVVCRWDPVQDLVEVHEFEADAETLSETMPAGASERTSGDLKGGHDYTYAVRVRRGSETSEFSERITLYVPAEGEQLDDDQDDDTETPPTSGGPHPSDVLDLRHWTVMLPVGKQGDPDNDYMIGKSIPNVFFVRDGGVVFRTPAGGVHSPNSKYARTELRQMADDDWTKAAFDSSGDHSLEAELSLDASGFSKRKRLNGLQIHNGGDDVCQIMRHETDGLGFMHKDGDEFIPIDPDYVDATRFKCKIEAKNDRIKVWYNDKLAVNVEKSGSGWYWKAGCYNQTDVPNYGEAPDACGEVVIYRLVTTGGAF